MKTVRKVDFKIVKIEIRNKKEKGFVTFGIMGDVDTGIQNVGSCMRNLWNVDLGENIM